jgi:hypothetical protein
MNNARTNNNSDPRAVFEERHAGACQGRGAFGGPPDVVNITLGRQLFLDDFLIGTVTEGEVQRQFYQAQIMGDRPVAFAEDHMVYPHIDAIVYVGIDID